MREASGNGGGAAPRWRAGEQVEAHLKLHQGDDEGVEEDND